MNLKDPVPAYDGADTVEVHILQNLLDEAGITAFIMEDDSPVGMWGGLVAETDKPQVWIEREDLERAKPVLVDYERLIVERRAADADADTKVAPIKVTCDKCHKESTFPHAQIGSVQLCPACGAYVDVTLDDTPDEQRVMTRDP
jgi:Putative prokaryotic signal transducing protein